QQGGLFFRLSLCREMVVLVSNEELFAVLEEFESVFRDISDEWTDACFESNFTDFDNLSQLFELSILHIADIPSLLIRLCGVLLRYGQTADGDADIWGQMAATNMKAQKLVVFLWYLIERGLVQESALEEQKFGLAAATAYLALCSLTGSQAFNIFNCILYQKTLDSLRGIYRLLTLDGFRGIDARGRRNKPGKKRRADPNSSLDQHSIMLHLTEDDKRELKEGLFDALDSFFVFLNKVSLSTSSEVVESTACLVGDLMRIDFAENVSIAAKECSRLSEFQSLSRFSERSFALMHRLMDRRHGGVEFVLPRIVMPRLIFWTFENTPLPAAAHPTKLMGAYKDAMIRFIQLRVKKENEEELDFLLKILENVCHRCPERSEYRLKVASTVCEVLSIMPTKYHYDFAHFIRIFGSISRSAWRAFTVEIVPLLLQNFDLSGPDPRAKGSAASEKTLNIDDENENKENNDALKTLEQEVDENGVDEDKENEKMSRQKRQKKKGKKRGNKLPEVERIDPLVALCTLIVRFCADKSSTVRARAIVQMVALLENEKTRHMLSKISAQMAELELAEQRNHGSATEPTPEQCTDSPLLNMLLNRCNDSRVSARKAAILALEAYFSCLTNEQHINCVIAAVKRGCRDVSLLMRKQSAESITHLLMSVRNRSELSVCLESSWLSSVMPLVVDREQSVSQFASKLVIETLISPILTDDDTIAWRLLAAVELELDFRRAVLRALLYQAKEGNLSEKVVDVLLKKCDQPDKANIIWMLLDDLSVVFKVDPSRAARVWASLAGDEPGDVIGYVAHVIGIGADRLKLADKERLREDLSMKLREYRVDDRHIPKVFWAYSRLYNRNDEETEAEMFKKFCREFLNDCRALLRGFVYGPFEPNVNHNFFSSQNLDEVADRLVRVVTSIGEVVQYDPSLITDDLSEVMQIIFASDFIGQQLSQIESHRQTPISVDVGFPTEHSHAVNGTKAVSRLSNRPSQGVTHRSSGPSQGTIGRTFVQSYLIKTGVFTSSVRARAVLTIGKMCLMDERLAKKCVPVFVKQLVENPDCCIRNNIVVVVCDLCIRYTLLIDRYSAIIALSLRDRSKLVRKQALALLTCLIKEQYIRWEGQIMYRLVSTLLDEDQDIREYAKVCLLDVLLVQFPKMFEHHFVECLFYFNHVEQGAWAVIKAASVEMETIQKGLACSLAGEKRREDRMKLYKFMLRTFNDESRFTLMERIGQEVFSAVAEGSLDLKKDSVRALLLDCYNVMCCAEIKLTMALGQRAPNSMEEDDEEPPDVVQAGAKKLVSQLFRKGIIEAVLPHLIELRYYVQNGDVPDCHERGILLVLRELCKDHKEQLDEFLAGDPLLKEEIRFDLKKLEDKERAEAERKQRILMSIMRSGGHRRPPLKGVQSSDAAMRRLSLPTSADGSHASTPSRLLALCAKSVDRGMITSLSRRIHALHAEHNLTPSNPRNLLHRATLQQLRQLRSNAVESSGSLLTPTRAVESQTAQNGHVRIGEQNGLQRMEPISEDVENEMEVDATPCTSSSKNELSIDGECPNDTQSAAAQQDVCSKTPSSRKAPNVRESPKKKRPALKKVIESRAEQDGTNKHTPRKFPPCLFC
uniref:Condensin complex subunit 1 C-terminal domain-containing protein n=1 Tax=Parascaris univalens TaxID=6257 RepID=A0A915AMC9_PARUN